jgi:hypothetical protein
MVPVAKGAELTVSGFAGAPNDVVWEIFDASTNAKIGASDFHISCSDADMNGAEDCGKAAGDAKGLTGFLNNWIFEGMSGGGKTLDCTPPTQPGSDMCEVQLATPSCTTMGKPTSLTFKYTGGGCAASNNPQGGKATCSGSIDKTKAILVTTTNSGYSIVPATVNPGQEFTVNASSFNADSSFKLTNAGGNEALKIHTSCSQVLEVGNVFGSLTLVGFNGKRAGGPINYSYVVTNRGAPLQNVTLTDNKLGAIAGPFSLGNAQIMTFTKSADIITDTTNVVIASGTVAGGLSCQASDSATVKVRPPVGSFTCSKPFKSLTMAWNDPANPNVWVTAYQGTIAAGTKLTTLAPVTNGGSLTVNFLTNPLPPNDNEWAIYKDAAGTQLLGKSTFHVSCSDADMNSADDCGKAEGNGKGLSGYLNTWILKGMVDSNETLVCAP